MKWYVAAFLSAVLSVTILTRSSALPLPSTPQFGKFEEAFSLPNQTGNPYDPVQNDVDVVFRAPSGAHIVAPAFWDGLRWRVRFCPETPGSYSLAVLRSGAVAPGVLAQTRFRCVPSDNPGFIRRSRSVVQQFVFDDGKPYYPFGMDVAWEGAKPGYPYMLQHLHDAHMNWARIWMTFWDGKALDWAETPADNPPIGTLSMDAARRWDAIFDEAAKDGVYVQMTLQHHGQYTALVDPNWAQNPFNVANGGFLKHPDDFFTDPRAISLTKAKYRYIVARWGYSTHLMSFELFNEVQNIREADTHFADVVAWHRTMAAYIRSIDPYHHLITTSNSPPSDPLAHIGLDYDQIHIYAPDIPGALRALPLKGLKKPLFVGEWGSTVGGGETAQTLHRGLWAGAMTPTAGAAEFWAWDQVVAKDWWPEFASLGDFLTRDRVAALGDLTAVDPTISASGALSDLNFAPPLGWAPTTSTDVDVLPSGKLVGIDGVSSFIQGTGHRDMMAGPIRFHVDCPEACRFIVVFDQASAAGAHPTLALDGAVEQQADIPAAAANHAANTSLAIDVPPGKHTVSLGNTGVDWVTVSRITLTDYARPAAAMVRESASSATFWVYCRSGPDSTVANVRLGIPGLASGRYRVLLWDPATGSPLPETVAVCTRGLLTVALPQVRGDVAGVVER